MSVKRIYINLKIPDNIERTALYTARNRLGFESLVSLQRTEFWEIDFPGLSSQQARQTVKRLVEKTSLFMNPNKHRWRMEDAETRLHLSGTLSVPPGCNAYILVCDREDGKGESTLEAIRSMTQGDEQPSSLLRGTLWGLTFQPGLEQDTIHHAVESLSVTTDRMQGLFANPHYQVHRIFYP